MVSFDEEDEFMTQIQKEIKENEEILPKDSSSTNFIHQIIDEEIAPGGRTEGKKVHTRFPPEPNGFLHIGHAKAICLDFGTAEKYGGLCNLRMDDTNPSKEDQMYVEAIIRDIHWLGFDWADRFFYASDYFDVMYQCAVDLIKKGLAFVDDLSSEELRAYRGTLTEPGKPSPYRDRTVEENLDLFARMKAGEFADGEKTLRAKIDMSSGNINMRDPVIYRIAHLPHPRTGSKWCIYPMYDFAHPLEDSIEGITHSLCSLEFEDHRPLYNWFRDHSGLSTDNRQIEFARLNLTHTVMSKRKLRYLVENGLVDDWDDPRLPTLSGMRRRGYTPKSIRDFIEQIGVTKEESIIDMKFLEYCVRQDLDTHAPRVMGVIDPIKLVIDNFPEDETFLCTIRNHPKDESMGTHQVPFRKELWIEREDFMIDPPKKYFRLFVGNEVRLQSAFIVRCTSYECDPEGRVSIVHAQYDPESQGGNAKDGRKIKGTIHWVPVKDAMECEIHHFNSLFLVENPDADERDDKDLLNPNSLERIKPAYVEPWVFEQAGKEIRYQFMRRGYYIEDRKSTAQCRIFNEIVSLRDSYKPGA